jgi:hypothetical protein
MSLVCSAGKVKMARNLKETDYLEVPDLAERIILE